MIKTPFGTCCDNIGIKKGNMFGECHFYPIFVFEGCDRTLLFLQLHKTIFVIFLWMLYDITAWICPFILNSSTISSTGCYLLDLYTIGSSDFRTRFLFSTFWFSPYRMQVIWSKQEHHIIDFKSENYISYIWQLCFPVTALLSKNRTSLLLCLWFVSYLIYVIPLSSSSRVVWAYLLFGRFTCVTVLVI